jgi:flagellar hook-basal body complex protein FliE
MAAKRVTCGSSSFLTSNTSDKQPVNTTTNTSNTFANDGSFLEQYKKRMEEMERAKTLAQTSTETVKDGDDKTLSGTIVNYGSTKQEDKANEDKPKTSTVQGNLLPQVWLTKIPNASSVMVANLV